MVVVGDFADPDGIVELVKHHMDPCRPSGTGPAVPIPRCWLQPALPMPVVHFMVHANLLLTAPVGNEHRGFGVLSCSLSDEFFHRCVTTQQKDVEAYSMQSPEHSRIA